MLYIPLYNYLGQTVLRKKYFIWRTSLPSFLFQPTSGISRTFTWTQATGLILVMVQINTFYPW